MRMSQGPPSSLSLLTTEKVLGLYDLEFDQIVRHPAYKRQEGLRSSADHRWIPSTNAKNGKPKHDRSIVAASIVVSILTTSLARYLNLRTLYCQFFGRRRSEVPNERATT